MSENDPKCGKGKTFVERSPSKVKEGKKPTIWNNPVQFCASNKQIDKKGYKRVAADEARIKEEKTARLMAGVAPTLGIAPRLGTTREDRLAELKKVNSYQELTAFYGKYGIAWPKTKSGEPMPEENFKKKWKDFKENLKKNL